MIARLLPLILLVALAGCGGGEQTAEIPSGDEPAASASPTETETETEAAEAPGEPGKPTAATKAVAATISDDVDKRPRIGKPKGDPPDELVIHDIVEGKGAAAKSGDQVEVDYAGTSWSTGSEFDASWKRKQTFPFTLGEGGVIQGWDQGVAGMKKGGRRLLVIPPDLGYGAQGQPPDIGPNETLVFVVDLREIG